MAIDPYAVLRALLRAEAARNTPQSRTPQASASQVPQVREAQPQQPTKEQGR